MRLPLTHALLFILALLMACLRVNGQETRVQNVGSMQWRPSKVAPADIQTGSWDTLPIRQVDRTKLSELLARIEERMPANHIYRSENVGNWAHETIHGLNSRLREELGAGVGCFYIGDGKFYVLRDPKIGLASVARYVPPHLRNDKYDLYLVKMGQEQPQSMGSGVIVESWAKHSLYPLDEWVAYIGASEVVQEYYGQTRSVQTGGGWSEVLTASTQGAIELDSCALALLKALQEEEPEYPDMDKLKEFIAINHARTQKLLELHPIHKEPIPVAHITYQQVYYESCGPDGCESAPAPNRFVQTPRRNVQPLPQTQVASPGLAPLPPRSYPTTPNSHPGAEVVGTSKPIRGCSCEEKGCGCDKQLVAVLQDRIAKLEGQITDIVSHPEKYKGRDGVDGKSPSVGEVAKATADLIQVPVARAAAQQSSEWILAELKKMPIEFQNINQHNEMVGKPVKAYLGESVAFQHFQE